MIDSETITVEAVHIMQIAGQLPGDNPDDPWKAPDGQGFVVMLMDIVDVRRMPMFEDVKMTLVRAHAGEGTS